MADLTPEQRRRNVRRARAVREELQWFEHVLLDVKARLPAVLGRVQIAKRELDEVLSGRPSGDDGEEESGGD